MAKVDIKLVKPKSRYVLMLYGVEIVYASPNFNKKLEWKNYGSAREFLMSNDFYVDGELINKDKIEIVEFQEQQDD